MQNRQSGRRRRSGGPNGRTMGQSMGGQSSSRLEVRVRGNANQLLEKYKQLARDSHQAGDRVAAEYYLQHADHYFRVLNDSRIRQEEMRARRGAFDQFEDEPASGQQDGDGADEPAAHAQTERTERAERTERRDRQAAPQPRGGREPAPDAAAVKPQVLELHLSDGEAALMAFGGAPGREVERACQLPGGRLAGRGGRPLRPCSLQSALCGGRDGTDAGRRALRAAPRPVRRGGRP